MAGYDDGEFATYVSDVVPDRGAARAALDDPNAPLDRGLWQRLADLGLPSLLLPNALGGGGGTLADQVAVSRVLARVTAPAPVCAVALAAVVLQDGATSAARHWANRLAAADAVVGVCLGGDLSPVEIDDIGEGDRTAALSGTIQLAAEAPYLDAVLVSAAESWWCVELTAPGLVATRVPALDPTRPVAELTLNAVPAQLVSSAPREWLEALCWLLIAAEATGVAEAALEQAVTHARQRVQFGRPIGSFQAIAHKLVDDLIAVEAARSALHLAVRSAGDGMVPATMEARLAKLVACEAATRVVNDAIQVQGAMANTWEHDAHLLLRRAKGLQATAGAPSAHRTAITDSLIPPTQPDGGARPQTHGARGIADRELSGPDLEFVTALRDWLDTNATPETLRALRSRDQLEQIAARRDWQRRLAEAGWAGIHWPREYGGSDASLGQQMLYHSELASRGLPPLIGNRGLSLIGPTIIVHGTAAQREHFVEATRTAEILWASGLSEREAGSDLASLRTRGVVDGNDIVINGHKIWTTSAQYADWLFCLIRTDPAAPKHRGITCMLVPLDTPGITVRPIRRITGSPDFNEVFLDDVRVPLVNVVGEINDGWRVARTTLSHEHMTNFLGTQMRLAGAVDRIIERVAGTTDQALRERVTDAWIDTQLLRTHGLRNVSRLEAGRQPGPEGSILKLFGQELEKRLFELGFDAGGEAAVRSDRWARLFLSTRASTVGGGTSEVHRNKLAARVLALPRLEASDEEPDAQNRSGRVGAAGGRS